ncbi:hypothetical protein K435DRAFT_877987 [Dendrothele bispora CBS 962.96]|uniref:Uncharacterized protein n=1 Tax=Dendrothele bispora (strain CBS 962.96) TaxID=1314807 RepID=A0A4S8KNZ7_DENBC|nr:hypothetical protein K435DRAFT_877987 [Dendrothele bispora CBS 962.96]
MHKDFRGEVVYNAETDVHFPNLTVGQTLSFAAKARTRRTRLPGVNRERYAEHMKAVVMAVFGLSHTKNTKVGNDFIRGVCRGERKRVSIAEVALSGSPLHCWDNSTRGSDSATALEYVKTLGLSTENAGTTAVVAIYQASQSIYDLFDKVTVLYEGRQIYGRTEDARQFSLKWVSCVLKGRPPPIFSPYSLINPSSEHEFAKRWQESDELKQLLQEINEWNRQYPVGGEQLDKFRQSRKSVQAKGMRAKSPYTISLPMQVRMCLTRGFEGLCQDLSLFFTTVFGNSVLGIRWTFVPRSWWTPCKQGAHPCPADANHAEWMLEVIGAAPGAVAARDYAEAWRDSTEYQEVKKELAKKRELMRKKSPEYAEFAAPFWTQFRLCFYRVCQQYWRTPSYIYAKIALSSLTSLFIGFSFYKADNTRQGFRNQMFSIFMLLTIFGNLVNQIMPHFVTATQNVLNLLIRRGTCITLPLSANTTGITSPPMTTTYTTYTPYVPVEPLLIPLLTTNRNTNNSDPKRPHHHYKLSRWSDYPLSSFHHFHYRERKVRIRIWSRRWSSSFQKKLNAILSGMGISIGSNSSSNTSISGRSRIYAVNFTLASCRRLNHLIRRDYDGDDDDRSETGTGTGTSTSTTKLDASEESAFASFFGFVG